MGRGPCAMCVAAIFAFAPFTDFLYSLGGSATLQRHDHWRTIHVRDWATVRSFTLCVAYMQSLKLVLQVYTRWPHLGP